jgi:hypothetical protein
MPCGWSYPERLKGRLEVAARKVKDIIRGEESCRDLETASRFGPEFDAFQPIVSLRSKTGTKARGRHSPFNLGKCRPARKTRKQVRPWERTGGEQTAVGWEGDSYSQESYHPVRTTQEYNTSSKHHKPMMAFKTNSLGQACSIFKEQSSSFMFSKRQNLIARI